MFRYDAVLFDMDGTLLDTVDDIAHALNQALQMHGYPTHGRNAVASFLGGGARRLVCSALPEHTGAGMEVRVYTDFVKLYAERHEQATHPYPGVLAMLAALDEAGLKLAIISNKSDAIVKRLSGSCFGGLIHTAVGSNPVIPLKPEPDMLLLAMQELGTNPRRTLYIGDAPTDFHAAQSAGMDCILVRWGYGNPEALSLLSPLFFANDPAELPMLIFHEQEDAP